ncbi:hypothetical protein ACP70R_008082 [Stipagrostis hirtigluma subsp. patula]
MVFWGKMVWKAKSDTPADLEKGAAGKKEGAGKEAFFIDPWREKVVKSDHLFRGVYDGSWCRLFGAVDHDFYGKAEVSVPVPGVPILILILIRLKPRMIEGRVYSAYTTNRPLRSENNLSSN